MLTFQYDKKKSASNLAKHGIDFEAAQALWMDPSLREVQAKSDDEPRFLVIGLIENKHWSAAVTHRSETIRIISVRHSRKKEVKLHES